MTSTTTASQISTISAQRKLEAQLNSRSQYGAKRDVNVVKKHIEERRSESSYQQRRRPSANEETCKKSESPRHQSIKSKVSSPRIKFLAAPEPLPARIKNSYKRSRSASESEKKRRQEKKREYGNKVGWQQRQGRHRHAHQGERQQKLLNYFNGMPLDYGLDSE